LMTSIALNSTKHKANAKDFKSLLVSGSMQTHSSVVTANSSQKTPEEMKI